MNTKLLPLLGLMFTLIACSSVAPGAPTPAAPTPGTPAPGTPAPGIAAPTNPPAANGQALNGRTFLSVKITDGGVVKPLVPNTVIRISFTDGQIGASAGCNTIGGTFIIDGDTLIFQGGGMTEMGCDPARHAQDDWLTAILGARPTISLNGNDLVLTSGTTAITMLDKEIAAPDQPLVGPTWTLSSLITGEAVSSVPMGVTATITFHEDGRVDIQPGCNSGGGNYTVDGDTITFTDLITTEMACMGGGGQVEAAVLAVLESHAITYAIDAGSLTLMAGNIGLQFTAD
ncbi:MAG: META domain-containing protein [Candidatus Limnocylindrales bacterium]